MTILYRSQGLGNSGRANVVVSNFIESIRGLLFGPARLYLVATQDSRSGELGDRADRRGEAICSAISHTLRGSQLGQQHYCSRNIRTSSLPSVSILARYIPGVLKEYTTSPAGSMPITPPLPPMVCRVPLTTASLAAAKSMP